MENNNQSSFILFKTEDEKISVDVRFEDETVWLSQEQMAQLFGKGRTTITGHIQNIFKEGELNEDVVCRNFRLTTQHGAIEGKTQEVSVKLYNLDVIISVGYRVKSHRGTQFRIWATKRLNEYIRKGFTMDDERLKNLGGGGYWKELLQRIRDIRASEKVFYRQVLDIYSTSIDYDPKADVSIAFFKKVQNKIHYAVHGQTAAEVIFTRADAEKEFMGLMTFPGNLPYLKDVVVAKNYLNEKELRSLGQLVSGYLDFAERQAEREQAMTMKDWAEHLDKILTMSGEKLLQGAGSISHDTAIEKATTEYKKYQQKTLSEAEKNYLDSLKSLENQSKLLNKMDEKP
ncbi:MAG: virulence RhuM family protein [Ignavibacteriales bacterium]|nr:virulence RhuM family protein [Melioribacteraceae bacterium]MCF8316613.1 virulence RhuM family protein [Ignavibacteriales bacterium]MCF8438267.1 virulence RhuM family protein [Ignavibacteriales bacterium]